MASFLLMGALAVLEQQQQQHQSAHEIPLTKQEALSGMFGSISIASWIFLLVPQLIENYRCGSAEAVSVLFIFIWFLGDVTNLIGALWAGLVPTVIATAVYFCFADAVLGGQCTYYNWMNSRRSRRALSAATANTDATEEEPLLSRRDSNRSIGLPGSHTRRRSSVASRRTANGDEEGEGHGSTLAKIAEEDAMRNEGSAKREWLKNTICVLLVCIVGVAGWAVVWKLGVWKPSPVPGQHVGKSHGGVEKESVPVGASIFGYMSAVLYVGARIPQIIKNYRDQSCEGLSLLFFMLSLLGNLSYGAAILTHSLEGQYVLTNLPWLIGSLGTMSEDAAIFIQFRIYGEGRSNDSAAAASEAVE